MSGSSSAAVVGPLPSTVRRFDIYPGGRRPGQGLAGPNAIAYWTPKHPLEENFWWADASALCDDLSDVILSAGYAVIGGDGALSIDTWCLSPDARWAGFWLNGGTPGVEYQVRLHLSFTASRAAWGGDVLIPVSAVAPVPTPDPTLVTNNGDILLLGGIPFPTGA
ncbi:hypothetical protein [Acidisoma sp. 7E03]